MATQAERFAASKQQFLNYIQDPRGQLFYQLLQAQLKKHAPEQPGAVLDVGCGFGLLDLWLAQAGHHVTGIDITPELLEVAQQQAVSAGLTIDYRLLNLEETDVSALTVPYDLVLCHNVLEYVQSADNMLGKLADCTAPGGLLSLVAHNPTAKVLQAALFEQNPALALKNLDKQSYFVSLIQAEVPIFTTDELIAKLEALGFEIIAHYGVRTVYDYFATEKRADPDWHQQMLALEVELSARSPFRDMAAFTHLVARKRPL